MATYQHHCPEHGAFDDRRPMADSAAPAACPACGAACPKVFAFDPARQLHLPNKFRTTFPTTGFLGSYGGGDWQTHVRNYHRWDSDFAGPNAGADLPPEAR